MPHPKRRHSKTRRDKRRTHHKAEMPTFTMCGNCGQPHLLHRVCTSCGHYRGKQVYEVKSSVPA